MGATCSTASRVRRQLAAGPAMHDVLLAPLHSTSHSAQCTHTTQATHLSHSFTVCNVCVGCWCPAGAALELWAGDGGVSAAGVLDPLTAGQVLRRQDLTARACTAFGAVAVATAGQAVAAGGGRSKCTICTSCAGLWTPPWHSSPSPRGHSSDARNWLSTRVEGPAHGPAANHA